MFQLRSILRRRLIVGELRDNFVDEAINRAIQLNLVIQELFAMGIFYSLRVPQTSGCEVENAIFNGKAINIVESTAFNQAGNIFSAIFNFYCGSLGFSVMGNPGSVNSSTVMYSSMRVSTLASASSIALSRSVFATPSSLSTAVCCCVAGFDRC